MILKLWALDYKKVWQYKNRTNDDNGILKKDNPKHHKDSSMMERTKPTVKINGKTKNITQISRKIMDEK